MARPRDPAYPWSSECDHSHHQRTRDRHRTDVGNNNAVIERHSIPSASAMQNQHQPRRNMGHIPATDGIDPALIARINIRNSKRRCRNVIIPTRDRRMVASATATNRSRTRQRTQTLMDSGAGLTVCNDDQLYLPGSKHMFPGEVVWGDGSRKRRIKYAGKTPVIGKMIHTGGEASTNLMSVGSTLDELKRSNKRDFVMAFDDESTYLMRDAKIMRCGDHSFRLRHDSNPASIIQVATRGHDPGAVYEVPLYDDQATTDVRASSAEANHFPSASMKRGGELPSYAEEPQWHRLKNQELIFDARVAVPSANASAMTKSIMRYHNAWGHPAPEALRQMLLAKNTQRSKRLARKVHDLFQPCNACLSGSSRKQPHVRDPAQPTTRATRPWQHVMSDCTGQQNIAVECAKSMSGAKIIYMTRDQYTKYTWLWLLTTVSEVTPVTASWLRLTARQSKRLANDNNTEIVSWRTDNGPDFPQAFTDLLEAHSIDHQRTGAKASQQNGGSETWLNVIQRKARTYIAWARGPRAWWGESALYTAVTGNHLCSLTNKGKMAPITAMYGRRPDFNKMHPFGCLAFINISKKNRNGALNSATHHGTLLGYATGSDGRIISYRIYDYERYKSLCIPRGRNF